MKRANKTGTIVKRNDKKRRLPYSVYLDGGHDPDTFRRKRIFLGSFTKRSEAQSYLERYLHGLVQEKKKIVTLSDIWKLYREDKLALTGRFSPNYDSVWKLYIKPKLGNMDVSDIRTLHMQNIINTCRSASTQKFIKAILTGLFAYAVTNDLTTKDYSAGIKTQAVSKSFKHKPFTTAELRRLWQSTDDDGVKVLLIQTYTGTRKSDLSGILMENVHLKERYMVGGVKTEAGRNRVIPIAQCILPFVRHFYMISKFSKYPYLLMPDTKRGMRREKDKVDIDAICRKVFGNEHSTHDARHTFVTMADNYGQPESLVKKIVGHKDNDITSTIYTHKSLAQLLSVVDHLPYGPEMYVDPGEKKEEARVAT